MPLLSQQEVSDICLNDNNALEVWNEINLRITRNPDLRENVLSFANSYIIYAKMSSESIYEDIHITPPFFCDSHKVYLLNLINQQTIRIAEEITDPDLSVRKALTLAKNNQIQLSQVLQKTHQFYIAEKRRTSSILGSVLLLIIAVVLFLLLHKSAPGNPTLLSIEGIFAGLGLLTIGSGIYNHYNMKKLRNNIKKSLVLIENEVIRRNTLDRIIDISPTNSESLAAKVRLETKDAMCSICIDPVSTNTILTSLKQPVFTQVEDKKKSLKIWEGPYHADCLVEYEMKHTKGVPLRDPNTGIKETDLTPKKQKFLLYRLKSEEAKSPNSPTSITEEASKTQDSQKNSIIINVEEAEVELLRYDNNNYQPSCK